MNSDNQNAKQIAEMLNSKSQFDLAEYWFMFWRRKWLVLGISFVVTTAAIIYAVLNIRPIYEVSATITIESKSILNTTLGGVSTKIATNLDRARILRKVFSSDYLNHLADKLDLRNEPQIIKTANSYRSSANWLTEEDALERAMLSYLRKKFDVSVTSRGDQFYVAVRDTSPVIAFEMVDSMTKIFVNQSRQQDLRGIRDVKKFSDEQLAVYKEKMDEAELNLREFNERLATNRSVDATRDEGKIKRLANLKDETSQNIEDRARRLSLLENRIPQNIIEQMSTHLEELIQMEVKVLEKQDDYKRVLEKDVANSSGEMQLNNELNLLRLEANRIIEKSIELEMPKLGQEQRNSLAEYILGSFDLFILKSRLKVISLALDGTIKSAAAQPALRLEQRKLEDEYEQQRRTFQVFLEQSRGTQIEEAIQNSDAEYKYQMVMPAQMPIYAVAGSKKNFVIIGFVLSLFLGVGLIVALELFDQTIRSEKDVQQLTGIAILGTIPKLSRSFENIYADLKESDQEPPLPRNGKSHENSNLDSLTKNTDMDDPSQKGADELDLHDLTRLSRS